MQKQQAPVIGSSAPDNRHLYLPPDQHREWIHQQHQADMNNGNDQELEQYFPTPSPRKPFVPSSYMNVPKKQQPASSRGPSRVQQQATSGTVQPPAVTPMGSIQGGVYGHHQQGPPSSANAASIRMGSMTPNRFTAAEMLRAKRAAAAGGQAGLQGHGGLLPGETDSHGDAEGGGGHEFRRSASARLHRNKRNNPEMFQQDAASSGPQDEHKRKEQVDILDILRILWKWAAFSDSLPFFPNFSLPKTHDKIVSSHGWNTFSRTSNGATLQ